MNDTSRFLLLAPASLAFLGPVLVFGSWWWVRVTFRANGRRAIAQALADRGETPIEITDVPMSAVPQRAGLAAAPYVFRVLARDGKGHEASYDWAYEPALVARQARSLKRLAHGIWIPLV